jgi:hypothetical protein
MVVIWAVTKRKMRVRFMSLSLQMMKSQFVRLVETPTTDLSLPYLTTMILMRVVQSRIADHNVEVGKQETSLLLHPRLSV